MNPTSLRRFAERYGPVGLLIVGICLLARHIWTRRRNVLLACLYGMFAGIYAIKSYDHPRGRLISFGGHELYLGKIKPDARIPAEPIEQQLVDYWTGGRQTASVEWLAHIFSQSVQRNNRTQAIEAGNTLCNSLPPLPKPFDALEKDDKWRIYAAVGEIYLEHGWFAEADQEFIRVLSTVPPGEPHWGKSEARQKSAYGLARSSALQGAYGPALKWLEQAPGEYNSGCGNHNEWQATDDYPIQTVWTAASKPYPEAVTELKAIMSGHFSPMASDLNGDTSEEQRQHAAVEASLTLGCLYYQAGRRADAEACWSLISSNANSQREATVLARAMLGSLQRD